MGMFVKPLTVRGQIANHRKYTVANHRLAIDSLEQRVLFANFVVSKLVDDGSTGTLRWAVQQANATSGTNTIDMTNISGQINLTQHTQLELSNTVGTVTITGPGSSLLNVTGYDPAAGGSTTRIFRVDANVSATISGITISDGTGTQGGGIYNAGALTLDGCIISGNHIFGASTNQPNVPGGNSQGGAIYSSGTLLVKTSSISGNVAYGGSASGAGGNGGTTLGGGIYSTGTTTITNSIISNNQAVAGSPGSGGSYGATDAVGIYAAGTLVVNDSTVAYNTNGGSGFVIASGASATLKNTLVTDSIAGSLQTSSSHSLVQDGSGGLTNGVNGNITNVSARLTYEGSYIGLAPGSPAIDAGDNSLIPSGVTTDLRGSGYSRIYHSTVDIGSIESSGFQFSFTTQPVDNHAGSTLANVSVAIKDSYGNYIADNSTVTLSLMGSGGGTLGGTTSQTVQSTTDILFTDLVISAPGTYTLVAKDLQDFGPVGVISNQFVISAALPPSSLIDVQFADFNSAQTGAAVVGNSGDVWNRLSNSSFSQTPTSLVGSSGGSTSVTLTYSGTSEHYYNSPFANGPFENLMSAALHPGFGSNGSFSLQNLTGSLYNLYIYSYGAQGNSSSFQVNGAQTQFVNNYSSSPQLTQGGSYVEIPNVSPQSGTITVNCSGSMGMFNSSSPIVNGFQLEISTQAPLHLIGTTPHYIVRDGNYLDVYNAASKIGTPQQLLYSDITSITVDGATSSTNSLTVDHSGGEALSAGNLYYDGGPFAAPLSIVGNPLSDTVSVFSNEVDFSSGYIVYTNVPAVHFDPNGGVDNIGAYSGSLILSPQVATTGIIPWRFSTMVIGAGATITADAPTTPASRHVLVAGFFYIYPDAGGPAGQLDLTGNDLIIQNGDQPAVTNDLFTGFNGGAWNGHGIASSKAASNSNHLTTLGSKTFTGAASVDNQNVASGDIVIKFGYFGDDTFDGHVDGSDYSRIDSGFIQHLTTYDNGDFNLDGIINGSDYTLIDNAFNRQGAVLATQVDNLLVFPAPAHSSASTWATTNLTASDQSILHKRLVTKLLDSWEAVVR